MANAVNDTLLLQVEGVVSTQQHIHTLHFRVNGLGDAPNTLMDQWMGTCAAPYRACFRTDGTPIITLRVETVCGTVPVDAPVERAIPFASGQGTKSEAVQPLPAYIASLVSEKSTLAGRRRQGRFFLGGMDIACINGQNISASYMAQIQAYVDALTAAFITPGAPDFRQVVHSRYLSQPHAAYVDRNGNTVPAYTPGSCQTISTPVASMVVSARATTMRSRKLGHGV